MAFKITVDYITDGVAKAPCNANAAGVLGPRDYKGDGSELKHRFRLLDDDGEVYYEGVASEVGHQPLDCFGEPNAGCTEIQFLNNKTWQAI